LSEFVTGIEGRRARTAAARSVEAHALVCSFILGDVGSVKRQMRTQ
jgi:hypothetical protein